MNQPAALTYRLMRSALRHAILPLLPLSLFAQGNTLRVHFEGNPSRNTTLGVFAERGTLYASANNLAEIFSLQTYENMDAKKLELKNPSHRIKLSAENPFIVVTATDQRQTILQLESRAIRAAHSYFVPLVSFIPLFNQVFGLDLSYDAGTKLLRVGATAFRPRFDLTTLSLEPKRNGMLIRVPSTKTLTDIESWLKQDGWLYVTIANATADVSSINRIKPEGIVRRIVAIQSPTSVQLTFKLSGRIAATEIIRPDNTNDVLISIRESSADDKILLERRRAEIMAGLEQQRKRWELDVIVIDPGHGGHDPGTIGVGGTREKDVTLAISLKLGKLIGQKLKGVKVVYTRSTDKFVELYRRGQIANEAGGKLFISIHANSMRRKPSPMRGFEVYLLRPGRTEEAIAIAERENAVIELEEGFEERYKQLTDENFILVTMAQSAHMKASEAFADVLQQEMEQRLDIPNRGVRQAGFYVLVGASMPNVLVESAYLSNRDDEKFLKSEAGQKKVAEALFEAVKRYKEEYEKLLTEGKDIGQR